MGVHNRNLNIHYSMPENLRNGLVEMFVQLPYHRGFSDDCSQWYGYDGRLIEASLEISDLQFYAELLQEERDAWSAQFQRRTEKVLGCPIGGPEDGYESRIYD